MEGSRYCVDHAVVRAVAQRKKHKTKPAGDARGPSGRPWIAIRAVVIGEETHCGICGEVVDKMLKFPHPQSASVDHIIPWRDGGAWYERSNLRLAHFRCNNKSNRSRASALAILRHAARKVGSVDVQGLVF